MGRAELNRFHEVQEAYRVLRDEDRRRQYDAMRVGRRCCWLRRSMFCSILGCVVLQGRSRQRLLHLPHTQMHSSPLVITPAALHPPPQAAGFGAEEFEDAAAGAGRNPAPWGQPDAGDFDSRFEAWWERMSAE